MADPRYRLQEKLGAGASGEVWSAVLRGPMGFRKPVALKLLHPGASDQALCDFEREAQLGVRLTHPNLIATYELGRLDGKRFIAMELVRGRTVHELLNEEDLSARAVVDILQQTATGLAHIHQGGERQVVHRDIKPANLLVDHAGTVKVANLGIAHLSSDADGRCAGTPTYMAPEQLLAEQGPQADVFALGVTGFVVLTRQPPFGRGREAMRNKPRVDALAAVPGFWAPIEQRCPALVPILKRCLRHEPAERPTAAELAHQLHNLERLPGAPLFAYMRTRTPTAVLEVVPPSTTGRSTGTRSTEIFVGRARERTFLERHLQGTGVLSLLGPGGIGKTRLVEEVVGRDSVWVPLQDVRTVEGLCAVFGSALQLRLRSDDSVAEIEQALRAQRTPLVIDNAEHLYAHRAVLRRWVRAAASAPVLVTSRRSLRLGGRSLRLRPLPLRDGVALFRSRAVRESDGAVLRRLVKRVDGLPLAIELCAARTRRLSPAEILAGIEQRRGLTAAAGLPGLHASFSLSWDQLSPTEREAFTQLSVFEGGTTLRAASAVLDLPDDAPVRDTLDGLVAQSLVRWDREKGRYTMLQTLADFARERLAPGSPVYARHRRWFAQLGQDQVLEGLLREVDGVRALYAEQDNLLIAYRRAMEASDAAQAGTLLVAAAAKLLTQGPASFLLDLFHGHLEAVGDAVDPHLWVHAASATRVAGRLAEAEELLERASGHAAAAGRVGVALDVEIERAFLFAGSKRFDEAARSVGGALRVATALGRHNTLARARYRAALIELGQSRLDQATALLEQVADNPRGPAQTRFSAIATLGRLWLIRGDTERAEPLLQQAGEAFEALADHNNAVVTLGNLGACRLVQGAWSEAVTVLEEVTARARRVGAPASLSIQLVNLGRSLTFLGRPDRARAAFREGLAIAPNDYHRGIHQGALAELELRTGDPVQAYTMAARAFAWVAPSHERWNYVAFQGRAASLLGRHTEAAELLADAQQGEAALDAREAVARLQAWRAWAAARAQASNTGELLAEAESLGAALRYTPTSLLGQALDAARAAAGS